MEQVFDRMIDTLMMRIWRINTDKFTYTIKMLLNDMLMKGLRRNDDAMKNRCWYFNKSA